MDPLFERWLDMDPGSVVWDDRGDELSLLPVLLIEMLFDVVIASVCILAVMLVLMQALL